MRQPLPLGMQDFTEIREGGFYYVDKTAAIRELVTRCGKAVFLSRPRRFGKTLLCSTIEALFEGRRELFGEIAGCPALAIDSLGWEWKRHPVIRLDLNVGAFSEGVPALHRVLSSQLEAEAEKLSIDLAPADVTTQFERLIRMARRSFGERVVVMIDEYDKPLLNSMRVPQAHEAIREHLKAFYGVLKSYDKFLRLVFVTGITRFAHVSIFSDLNHLTDLSFAPRFAELCGITQSELEVTFGEEIAAVASSTGVGREEYLGKLHSFYNGYRFTESENSVYNPYGLLLHFDDAGKFGSYWYKSGSPTFLVDLVSRQSINIAELGDTRISEDSFHNFDADNMDAVPVLYQSGYLTVKEYDSQAEEYVLGFPNVEVESAFSKSLLVLYYSVPFKQVDDFAKKLRIAFHGGDLDGAMIDIRAFLASVDYEVAKPTKCYFQSVIFVLFKVLGLECKVEMHTATGRVDLVLETQDFVYCFEFKLDKSADRALAQI
ncbi:MAG: ATP-binding protein, partial [Polyangiaceae bacterium]|nr:ATP-binding protein [Polyangiaceae bacterium]